MNEKKKQVQVTTYLSESDDDFKIINKMTKSKEGLEELRKRGSFKDCDGDDIPPTFLSNKDIRNLKSIISGWEENVFLVGVWEETKSYIFMDTKCENIFCISCAFVKEMTELYK